MPDDIVPVRTGILRIDPARMVLEPLDLDAADFQSPLPVQHYGLIFEDDHIGLAVGIWDTTTMQEAFGPYPGDEYITVLDGSFAMVDAAQAPIATARAGDGVTFRNGAPSSWKQEGYLRKIYLTLQDPDAATPSLVSAQGAFCVIAPDRRPEGRPDGTGMIPEVIFRNDAGTMTVALCALPPGTQPPATSPVHLLMRVLCGSVTLSAPADAPETFGPGDHVFVPRGTLYGRSVGAGAVVVMVEVTAP